MRIVMSSGHGLKIRGAAGPAPWGLDEVNEARKVVEQTAVVLRSMGVDVVTYHDDISTSQSENLNRIVAYHNDRTRDLDVSIHFNAYQVTTTKPMGIEVLYVSQEKLAKQTCDAMVAATGLPNRGPKYRSDLAFLNNTNKPAILVETLFCDAKIDCDTYRARFSALCTAIAEGLTGQAAQPDYPPPLDIPVPPERPDSVRPTIAMGDDGKYVEELQKAIGVVEADGDFGSITDTWTCAFQGTCGIAADGIVGPVTWDHVDALQTRLKNEPPPLSEDLAGRIHELASDSDIADFSWPDRGMMPPGYIPGMAQAFAVAVLRWKAGKPETRVMAMAASSIDTDALAWYSQEFARKGMSNNTSGLATLRHLFVMMIGLGPRESSGRYFEGRDMSATNVASDTAEAGLFQTSWNIKAAHSSIAPLLDEFWINPNGFQETFRDGINPLASNLNSYGSGDGLKYQWLSRFCPLFHCLVTAVGMRTLRGHWGPINRREVSIEQDADVLLQAVQDLVEDSERVALIKQ